MFRSLLSLLLFTASIAAQVSSSSEAHQPALDQTRRVSTFRGVSRLVNVFVVATDHEGHFVSGLKPDDFQILDDGHAEKTAFFASAADMSVQDNSIHPLTSGEYTNDLRRRGLPAQSATVVLLTPSTPHICRRRTASEKSKLSSGSSSRRTISGSMF